MDMISQLFAWTGSGLCHRLPERSFIYGGIQFPVCARDTGIYLGIVVGLIALSLIHKRERRTEFPPLFSIIVLLVLFATMAFDGVSSYLGLRDTTNVLRLFSGMAAGFAVAGAIMPILNDSIFADPVHKRVLDTPRSLALYLGVLLVSYAVAEWVLPLTGVVYGVLSWLTIIATFTLLNTALVCIVISKLTNSVGSLKSARVPFLGGLVLSVAEIALLTLLWRVFLGQP